MEQAAQAPMAQPDNDSDSDSIPESMKDYEYKADKQQKPNLQQKVDNKANEKEEQKSEPAFDRAKNWYMGVVGTTLAHRDLAEMCEKRSRYLNVTRVVFNSIVSSAIFTSIGDSGGDDIDYTGSNSVMSGINSQYALQIGAGTLSIIVAILTAVSSALDYEGRKEAHSNAKKAFSKIKHQMEILLFIKQTPLVTPSRIQPMEYELYDEVEVPRKIFDMNKEWAKVVADWEQVDMDSPDVPGELKKKYSENQPSLINSLSTLDPQVYSPNIVNKKSNYDYEEEEEAEEEY